MARMKLFVVAAFLLFVQSGETFTVRNNKILDRQVELTLRGVNIGGWLIYDDILFQFKDREWDLKVKNEFTISDYLDETFSEGSGQRFFDGIRQNFLAEEDVQTLKDLGADLIVVPFSYHLFDNDNTGFLLLDQLVEWTRNVGGMRIVLSLKAAPGCQNEETYCSEDKKANLWKDEKEDTNYQDETIDLWTSIATHYLNSSDVILGYNLLSAPKAPNTDDLEAFYKRIIAAIRSTNSTSVLFVEGQNGKEFEVFNSRWVLRTDNNTMYGLQLNDNSKCPLLSDYASGNAAVVDKALEIVEEDEIPIMITEYGGNCEEWIRGATTAFQDEDLVTLTGYYTYKGNADGKGPNLYTMKDSSAWDSLCRRLVEGDFAEDAEWEDAFAAFRFSNFEEKKELTSALSDYFSGEKLEYKYQWWPFAAILGGALLIVIGLIIFAVVYRKRRNAGKWDLPMY
eukprot:TRINITY_DN2652_c0_g1_i1.p2 TRINITY_DN2652_c0_g1~~TRINITY_DN2652_c0_g1_i1.p2  ORF type:complete len:453 (+),score=122.69 TRINITY_DN2652_c0_g1_i1:313-1671(+)